MQCPHCKQEHSEGAQFCLLTGKKIVIPQSCPECGKPVDPNWLHCGFCGQALIQAVGKSYQQETQELGSPPALKPSPELPKTVTGYPKKRWSTIMGVICGLLIVAVIVLFIIWGSRNNGGTGYIIIAGYLGIWLLLFTASHFIPLSKHIIFLSKHWDLYIPFVSWFFTVFPLVLPPIPLGPIQISLAWSRRRMFPFYKEGCEYLGKQEKNHGFPGGWLVNFFINLLDIATLGLAQLFATASLLKEMIQASGTDAERAEIDPLRWCFKWLLLGNVFFLAVYIVCPGVIFAPLLIRMEKHYELHRETDSRFPNQPIEDANKPKLSGHPDKDASILLHCSYDKAELQLLDLNIQHNIKVFQAILDTQEPKLAIPFFKQVESDIRLSTVLRWKARECLRLLETSQNLPGLSVSLEQLHHEESAIDALLKKYSEGYATFLFGQYHQYQVFSDGRFVELADQLPSGLESLRTRAESKPLKSGLVDTLIPSNYRSGKPVTLITVRDDGKVALSDSRSTVMVDLIYFQYLKSRYPDASIVYTDPSAPVFFLDHDNVRAILMPMH